MPVYVVSMLLSIVEDLFLKPAVKKTIILLLLLAHILKDLKRRSGTLGSILDLNVGEKQ